MSWGQVFMGLVQKSHWCTCRTKNKDLNPLSQSLMQDLVWIWWSLWWTVCKSLSKDGEWNALMCEEYNQLLHLPHESTWANSTRKQSQSQIHEWRKENLLRLTNFLTSIINTIGVMETMLLELRYKSAQALLFQRPPVPWLLPGHLGKAQRAQSRTSQHDRSLR